nr:TonB-dependent receptor [Pseudopedobacter sp.]
MKKISLFVLLLIAPTTLLFCQEITVSNKTTLHPIKDISVLNSRNRIQNKTNTEGKVFWADLSLKDTLTFEGLGYLKLSLSFSELKALHFKILMTEQANLLNEIVVSASRFEEKKSDVPQQIEVIKAREIQFANQANTADLLQQSGKVLVQKSQAGGGSPIIRGFEGNKVLMVVDGVRMNNAIYRGGHLQNVITLDQNMLERVEIVFGPGSVVYGSDALGGVMYFYTKKPILSDDETLLFKANLLSRYASATSERTENLNLNFGFKNIAFLTSFTFSDFGNLKQGANRKTSYPDFGKRFFYQDRMNGRDTMLLNADVDLQKESGYKQYDFLQKIVFKPSENIEHGLNIQYSTSSNINRYDRLSENSGSKLKYAEWYYGPQKRLLSAYHFNYKTDSKLLEQLRIVASYQDIDESRMSRKFANNNLDSRLENVKVYALNADAEKAIKNHEIRYGFEYTHNKVQSIANRKNIASNTISALDTRYADGGSKTNSTAFYLTHSWEISPKFILSDGLRLNILNLESNFEDKTFFPFPFNKAKQNATAVNGNIGFSYLPDADWKIAILASSGFRAPNVDDLSKVFESTAGNIIVPNPNLKPEHTYNAELNISKTIVQKVNLQMGAYYTWYRDAITVQNSTFNGQSTIVYNGQQSNVVTAVNAAKAYIYGFDAQLSAQIFDFLNFKSSLNYTYGRVIKSNINQPLDHIPPLFGQSALQLKIKKFQSEFFAQYNGWKRLKNYSDSGEDNLQYVTADGMPSWSTFNWRNAYQINKNLNVQFAIENISDQNYRVFASGISSTGRNFILSLRANF